MDDDERTNENFAFFSMFGGVLRTAAKNRKKCFETSYFAFFSIFGGVLRTAAKNRKKCFENCCLELTPFKLLSSMTKETLPNVGEIEISRLSKFQLCTTLDP